MKKQRLYLIITYVLVLSLMLTSSISCGEKTTTEVKTLNIGLITSVTGPFAPVAKPQIDSIPATEEILNELGGVTINGQKYNIKIIVQDDQTSPPGGVTAINALMQQGITLTIPSYFPPVNLAIAPIAEQNKIIRIMSGGLGNFQVNSTTKYSFYSNAVAYDVAPVYDYLAKTYPEKKKIALVLADDPETPFVKEVILKEIQKHGLQVVSDELYTEGIEDFSAVLTKALANKPDAIDIGFAIPPWAKGLIVTARDFGFTGPIYASLIFGDVNLLNSMLPAKYSYDLFSVSVDVNSPQLPSLIKDLKTKMEKGGYTGFNRDNTTLLESLFVLVQAIKKAQSFDTTKIVETIENMKGIETIYGSGQVGGMDLFGINHVIKRALPLVSLSNGTIKLEMINP